MSTDSQVLQPLMVVAETYEIERLIGRGGMGEVWSASHRRLPGKHVAVKVLRLNNLQAGPELLGRFKREAEIAARLSHPNIVEVLDFNTLPTGQPYIVMELLRGESLADRLKKGPLSYEALKPIARQVGAALEAAHALGVVHRDLKPENIYLVPTALGDQVKVLDFGISKLAESSTLQTTDAVLIGTPLYMSPEQALGHNRDVSAQSDIFSLGSICYEALSGHAPFAAPSIAQVVFKIAYEAPLKVSDSVASLPVHAAAAIEHALQKDRAHRTVSARAFVEELTRETLPPPTPAASGVYVPETNLTPSMVSGVTATPQAISAAAPFAMASPIPLVQPAQASASASILPAPKRSTAWLWAVLGVLFLAGIGPFAWKLTRAFETERTASGRTIGMPPVREQVADAAVTVPPAIVTTDTVDAGMVVSPEGLPDASVAPLRVAVKTAVPVNLGPPGAVDEEALKDMVAVLAAKQYKQLWNRRAAYDIQLKSAGGKRDGLLMVLEAGCMLREPGVTSIFNQLTELAPTVKFRAKRMCKKFWPDRDL